MFLLLSRNNPYLEELNGNSNNQMAQKDLEGIEIDLKNRFKDQEKNFKMRHYQENSFESQDELISEDEDSNDNSSNNSSSLISLNSDSKIKNIKEENKIAAVNKEEQEKLEKLRNLKNLVKLMDLIGTLILFITHVLSQLEDDEYYNYNKEVRISGSLLINYLYTNNKNTGNITWEKVFLRPEIQLRKFFHYCLENENKTMHKNYPKKIKDYMARNNLLHFHNLTNLQILEANDITPSTFGMEDSNNLAYSNFRIKLKISKLANNLRIIILVLTILSFFLYFSSWYLQYFKEEKLESELLSSKKENQEDNEETKNNENSVANINNNNMQKIKRFYNSNYFLYGILDFIFLALMPYPNESHTFIIKQSKIVIIYPVSSLFNAFLSFRVFFFFKLLNIYSLYRYPKNEKILLKNSVNPDFFFNLKAYQKKYPLFSLIFIFILTIYAFGLFVRYFEMYYWEGVIVSRQLWNFRWNAFWCLFISMTTVAFGDFYPKTHIGRFLIIIATIIGIYFISMTMKYITQKSILTNMEQKAYKLITRLRHRAQLKNVNANIIYHSLKMIQLKRNYKKKRINNNSKDFDLEFNSEKKEILEQIEEYKIFTEKLKTCDKIQTKDQLIDILEQIEKNISDIETELDILEKMNISFSGYKNTQLLMIKFLKKSILNTQFIYEILQRNPKIFGVLGLDMNNIEKDKHKLQQQIDNLYTNYQEAGNADSDKKDQANDSKLNIERKSLSPFMAMHNRNNKGKTNIYAINNNNERNNQGAKKDQFNWEKFFTPVSIAQNAGHKNKKNKRLSNASDISKFKKINESGIGSASSTMIGNGRKILTEDLYSRELQKYTVEQNDFTDYFYSVFFEKNSENISKGNENMIQSVIMRNSPKTLSSVKVMKSIKNKIDSMMKQKNKNNTENSSFNSMTELKDEDNVD